MRVIIAPAILAVSLSLGACSHNIQAAHAKPLSSPPPTKASPVKTPPLPTRKFAERQSRVPPSGSPSAQVRPPAAVIHYVVLDPVGNCAVVDSKPSAGSGLKIIGDKGGYGSSESASEALKDSKVKCKNAIRAGALPTTIDTVGGIASALDLGKTDQAVLTAKAYMDNLKVNVRIYYRGLASDRLPSEEAEAAINLVPGTGPFDSPEQGIANLKLLRQGIEKELAIDEAEAQNDKFAEAQKANERVLNARRLIRAIGTDEELDNALANMNTVRVNSEWPDVVKMLTAVVDKEAEVTFKATQSKAKKLGGIHKLTQKDIDCLSYEQVKQLRGY
jgi:hypothetical protein